MAPRLSALPSYMTQPPASGIGVVVGLAAEARLARPLGLSVAIGGGTDAGAEAAAARLIRGGATGLISFGLAGGLDPALRPGAIVVPRAIITDGRTIATDLALSAALGGPTPHMVLGADTIAADAETKRRLRAETGAEAIDLESGAVARMADAHGLPCAAIRVVCDPAERTLPPAALAALNASGATLSTSSYESETAGGNRTVTAGRAVSAVPEPKTFSFVGGLLALTLLTPKLRKRLSRS